ncbi:MAG TPA: class I tRNA ligase family protein, partial [Puia sp.]
KGIGVRKVNYRMRDAAFSRQRYWGEPFPIVWKDGIAVPMDEKELPLELPHIEKYGAGPEGEGPLANIPEWTARHLETNTMPGYAGSSWYFLRYMDPHNDKRFCSREASDYWGQVDLYIGGTEHAVGHLLYSRMWTKFLYDRGWIGHDEPYKRLVNQGMIQGSSRFVYRLELKGTPAEMGKGKKLGFNELLFASAGIATMAGTPEGHELITQAVRNILNDPSVELGSIAVSALHVDVNIVDGVELDTEAFKKWRPEYAGAQFILEDGKYICGTEVEKMSKSKFNTVNPDDLVSRYGADTFRMYEMFLGPVEASKPWDTKGIEGVHRFLRKLWRLFFDETKGKIWTTEKATDAEWKVIYKTIKKVEEATERFSFNTGVSALMIGVNEITDLNCHKKEVLEKLIITLVPYAPHVCEELWEIIGNEGSILDARYPAVEEKYLVESSKNYPVAINGKTRTELNIALDATQRQVEDMVLADELVKKWLDGKAPKKVIYVKNKMINVVV